MNLGLKAKQIFLTGASGFIGARLAECLTKAYGAEVHALVRRFGTVGTARLARLAGVRMFYGDIRDAEAVRKAAQACSHFIHCATGTSGSRREQREATVGGTRNVLEAAVELGAERLVYFSSAAVHSLAPPGGIIREDDPLDGRFPYAQMKILAESLVSQYHHSHRLPVVILRPTCVWGPFSPNWTIAAVELIRKEIAFLPLEGGGTANAVHIDNLVDAVFLALTKHEAAGQTFLINDDEPRTWGELYGGYARFLEVPLGFFSDPSNTWEMLRVSFHNAGILLQNAVTGEIGMGIRALRELYNHVPVMKVIVSVLPEVLRKHIREYAADREKLLEASGLPTRSAPGFLPYNFISRPTRELYGSHCRYSNEKAKQILGWAPRVSFEEAMALTFQWLAYAGYKD